MECLRVYASPVKQGVSHNSVDQIVSEVLGVNDGYWRLFPGITPGSFRPVDVRVPGCQPWESQNHVVVRQICGTESGISTLLGSFRICEGAINLHCSI